MSDVEATRFDRILKKADDDSQAFFSGMIILLVGIGRALYTFPRGDDEGLFAWGWKVTLFFGLLIPFLWHLWKTSRFVITRNYQEAGRFMTEARQGAVSRELSFRHLWAMREIAWAEHQALSNLKAPPAAGGFMPILLVDAPGEAILEHTRITCAGCGRKLSPTLASDLWRERARGQAACRVREDLDESGRCVACRGTRGCFRTALTAPPEG